MLFIIDIQIYINAFKFGFSANLCLFGHKMEYNLITDFVREYKTGVAISGAVLFLAWGYLLDTCNAYKEKNRQNINVIGNIKSSLEKILQKDKPL